MKIAFFGTGEFSRNILKSLLTRKELEVSLVVSQPDKPVGRKKVITPTAVKVLAEENNIKILQPIKLRDNKEFFNELKGLDFIVVVAYGKIVPNQVLDAPKYGCINIHGSILPAYRGASPIQESVKNGDKETGLTIMYMSEGMDEGDILKIEKVNINITDTTEDIFNKFENVGTDLLLSTLEGVLDGSIKGQKQDDSLATYCSKISKQDGEVNFKKDNVLDIYNKFRSYSNWPGIYSYYNNKKFSIENCYFDEENKVFDDEEFSAGDVVELGEEGNLKVGIICKKGVLVLTQVKIEGKKSVDIKSFINGNKEFLDYKF